MRSAVEPGSGPGAAPDEGSPDRWSQIFGSHVADQLLARGHDVAIVDDLSSGKRENIPEKATLYERYIRGGCADVLQEFGPDALSHQAAQMDVRRSVRELSFDADTST